MGVGDVPRRRGRIWVVVPILVAVALLVLAACAYRPFYYAGKTAQHAADGAALGGLRQLSLALQQPTVGEDQIVADMVRFAARYALDENDQVVGYYLDAKGNRLGLVGSGIPREPHGIEAVVTVRVPTP